MLRNIPVFAINLDDRRDRWLNVLKQFHGTGLQLERVPAVRASPGWKGCGYSHMECIKIAKERQLPFIVIVEDDIALNRRSLYSFEREILPFLMENLSLWHRFSGGPTVGSGPNDPEIRLLSLQKRLFYCNGFCTHFDVLNSNAYDIFLSWQTTAEMPIDSYYLKLGKEGKIQNLCSYPHIATQLDFQSDISTLPHTMASYFGWSQNLLAGMICSELDNKDEAEFLEFDASHPRWTSTLRLYRQYNIIRVGSSHVIGEFRIFGQILVADWYEYPAEVFQLIEGSYSYQAELV